ncbi:MAG: polyprenyl synthetase family protein [Propioniciclava sp.]
MVTLDPADPLGLPFLDAVTASISRFLDGQDGTLTALSPELAPVAHRARQFTSGGKRLRPAFCAWGYLAVGGGLTLPTAVTTAASSLDLLHVSALIHDDVMDASDQRRGIPTAHRQFEADHRSAGWRGDASAFGRAAAILLGDLLLVWSEEMLRHSGLAADALTRAQEHLDAVRTEVTAGQYLDIVAQAHDPVTLSGTMAGKATLLDVIRRVVTWKSAAYTVRRPLLLGAALAGGSAEQAAALAAFGEPLGRAFQYQDDLLGVFGTTQVTGKETGEDLREGKLTLLIAEGFAAATSTEADELGSLLGHPGLTHDDVDRARTILEQCGARSAVEAEIEREFDAALQALDGVDLSAAGRRGLRELANRAVRRDH